MAACMALVLVAGLAWGVSAGVRSLARWREEQDATASSRSAVPKPKTSKKPASKAPSSKPTKEEKKSSVPNCGASNTQLVLDAPQPTTTVGGFIDFTASIRHQGSDSCLIDAANNSRVLVITSGEQTIWRSDSCPVDSRLLLMAQGDRDDQQIRWNANASGDQCQPDENLPRVNPGTYKAQLELKSNPKVKSAPVPLIVQ
ncbi:hypothetical protein KIM372_13300 [Bombiscardovia nodaiensis]|uniref:Uncharacterized protein n=1 Tax=Bombiscardovia nodaiensis TaxID=2932181 RepID=A0ABN6SD24_9BIFI|nr:hypothetical protein KIM372_13300 [Bombiscardovia nodaiensis]